MTRVYLETYKNGISSLITDRYLSYIDMRDTTRNTSGTLSNNFVKTSSFISGFRGIPGVRLR